MPQLKVQKSTGLSTLKGMLKHPEIKDALIHCKVPYSQTKRLVTDGNFYYNLLSDGKYAGLIVFVLYQPDVYLLDLAILSKFRGKIAYNLIDLAKIKFFKNHPLAHVLTAISINNKKALFFALKSGMKIIRQENDRWYLELNYGRRN